MHVSPPIPILRSFDEAATRAFYTGFLDFEEVFAHRFEPGLPLYLAVRRGGCELHLSEHHGDATPGSAVRIGVGDVDGLCAALRAKAHPNARPTVTRQPWGLDEMSVTDPSGNRLIFFAAATPGEP